MSTFNPAPTIGYQFGSSGTTGSTFSSGTTASSGTKVGNYLRSDSGQQNVSALVGGLLNFGLTAFSSNQTRQDLKAQANMIALQGQNQLATAQEGTKQAELAYKTAQLQGAGAGGSTALYVGLGVVGVVILGVVIYAVAKR